MSTKSATSKQARTRVGALSEHPIASGPVLDHLHRVLRRHCSVGSWTPAHDRGVLYDYTNHDFNAPHNRCLKDCVIPDAMCGHCPGAVVWPCADATDAMRLITAIERGA